MKRFQRLISLTEYISTFSVPGRGIRPLVTTAQADATSKLAHLSGIQVLAARPECRQSGNTDSYDTVISTAFFVIDKSLAQASTPDWSAGSTPNCSKSQRSSWTGLRTTRIPAAAGFLQGFPLQLWKLSRRRPSLEAGSATAWK